MIFLRACQDSTQWFKTLKDKCAMPIILIVVVIFRIKIENKSYLMFVSWVTHIDVYRHENIYSWFSYS